MKIMGTFPPKAARTGLLGPRLLLFLCWVSPAALGLEKADRAARFDEYVARLRALVADHGAAQRALAAWCVAQGLEAQAAAAAARADACDAPPLQASLPPIPRVADPGGAFTAKANTLAADTARAYAALGRWCQERGLVFEARRCAAKALSWNPRGSQGRELARAPALKGSLLLKEAAGERPGVWKSGRWTPAEQFRKSAEGRVAALARRHGEKHGLAFTGDFLPCVDVLTTVEAERFEPVKQEMARWLDRVRGPFFLEDPKKPFLFFYLRGPEEFEKMGKNPWMGGAYEWGLGELYTYPGVPAGAGPVGGGVVLHELTHAMLEANFRHFPPLWMNEGLACFFETCGDLAGDAPFGVVNARDGWYAAALEKGKARSLPQLLKECALSIDPLGYAQGRTLMNYLWSKGQLEAFVISAQLREMEAGFDVVLADVLLESLEDAGRELEAFAAALPGAGSLIPRGVRADEALDRCVEAKD